MTQKDLSYEQNIRSAIIFLNTFGLILEEQDYLDENSKLKIINDNFNEVGELYFENGYVKINTKTNFGDMTAQYENSKYSGFADRESASGRFPSGPRFAEWCAKINYEIKKDEQNRFKGNIILTSSIDDEFGINCLFHPEISYYYNDEEIMKIYFQAHGKTFCSEVTSSDIKETIDMQPADVFGEYIKHIITKGKWDNERHGYEYQKYFGITRKSSVERNVLKQLIYEDKYLYENVQLLKYVNKVNNEDSNKESVIQKGLLMQEIDPDMSLQIKKIEKFFTSGNVNLINNFINISMQSWSDEEIEALLGIKREPMKYQNGADNLYDAYFGIGKDNKFLPESAQKKLMPKKK